MGVARDLVDESTFAPTKSTGSDMASDPQSASPKPARPVRVKHPSDRRSLSRSATRALDVLEHFGQIRRPLRAIEISKALGLHPSTTNQLLKTMVESAHLVFDAETKAYVPSHRLACFCAWIISAYGGGERLLGLVREVQSSVGEVVTLTTPNDLFMQIVDLAGGGPFGASTERGMQVSIFGTAIGAAYLSTLSNVEIARLAVRARMPPQELADVLAEAARNRAVGYADGPSGDGSIWSIATPVPSVGFPTPLVLGLAGQADRVRPAISVLQEKMRSALERWASPQLVAKAQASVDG
jgi:DNA-binding IclR family transcriptional regulator